MKWRKGLLSKLVTKKERIFQILRTSTNTMNKKPNRQSQGHPLCLVKDTHYAN